MNETVRKKQAHDGELEIKVDEEEGESDAITRTNLSNSILYPSSSWN